MHIQEAQWIARQISSLPKEKVSPLLNVGSSTEEYRLNHQPHIEKLIFKPLRNDRVEIVHQDIKAAPGVDLVGDLTKPSFLHDLQGMCFGSVLCSNLMEHILNRQEVADALAQIVPVGGYIVVTVPSNYPKHMDPIDTLFRPTTAELARMFPNTAVVDSNLIDVGTVWSSVSQDPTEFVKLIGRVALPFYRHTGWITAYNKLLWMFRKRTIACVCLRKVN